MAHSVVITTPMPTLDELGKRLGLTEAQQESIIRIVDEKISGRSRNAVRRTKSLSGRSAKTAAGRAESVARGKTNRARASA